LDSIVRLEVEMADDLLKASEAARRLGIPTKEVLRLIHERKLRYVMVRGIAHVPDDAVEEFRARAS
jgi:excisionase family DNA binding protein